MNDEKLLDLSMEEYLLVASFFDSFNRSEEVMYQASLGRRNASENLGAFLKKRFGTEIQRVRMDALEHKIYGWTDKVKPKKARAKNK